MDHSAVSPSVAEGKDGPAKIYISGPLGKIFKQSMNTTIHKVGFWSGSTAFTATIDYCIVQILQLYDAFTYPTDERLIYGTSLCIVIAFLLGMLALHHTTSADKKFWSHGALIFTILYAVFVTANYVVQLATVIPRTLKGSLNEVRIVQQTPHSLFWNFDALGYIFMGLATFTAIINVTAYHYVQEKIKRGRIMYSN